MLRTRCAIAFSAQLQLVFIPAWRNASIWFERSIVFVLDLVQYVRINNVGLRRHIHDRHTLDSVCSLLHHTLVRPLEKKCRSSLLVPPEEFLVSKLF